MAIKNIKDKVMAFVSALMLFLVVGGIYYTEFMQENVVIVVDLKDNEDPFRAIPHLLPRTEVITSIEQVDKKKNEYKLVVRSRQEKNHLLAWILGSGRVEHAEVNE